MKKLSFPKIFIPPHPNTFARRFFLFFGHSFPSARIFFSPSYTSFTKAIPTKTGTIFSDVRIFFRKLVPVITVGPFCKESAGPNPSDDVFFVRNGFEMIRIYANSVSAKVIDYKSGIYFPLMQFIRKSVGTDILFSSPINSISAFSRSRTRRRAHPNPAPIRSIFIYLLKEFHTHGCSVSFLESEAKWQQ